MRLRRIRGWLAQVTLAPEPLEKCRFAAPPVVERFRPFNPSRGFAKPEVTGSIPVLHTRKARERGAFVCPAGNDPRLGPQNVRSETENGRLRLW
jgi:hypothetical protein